MGTNLIYIIGTIGASIVTGIAGWFVTHRNKSGRIDTTEAAVLWTESREIRQDLRNEIVFLRQQVKELQDKYERIERELVETKEEAYKYHQESEGLRTQIIALQEGKADK